MDVKLSEALQRPLKGIRVIDVTSMITGPMCSQQSDILVENFRGGEPDRVGIEA